MAFPNPTDAFTKADLDNFIPEVWAPIVHDIKAAPMSLMNFVTDLSYLLDQGGDVINVPAIYTNLFTVQTQSTEANGVVDEGVASTNNQLTVNTHKYIAFVMGKKTMRQIASKYQLNEKYAAQARELLVKAVEDSLFGLYTSFTRTAVGSTTAAITDLDLRSAIAALSGTENKVYEYNDLAFFLDTTVYWNQVLGIAKYYDKSISNMAPVQSGNFGSQASAGAYKGRLYDIPVYVTPRVIKATNVAKNMLVHKEAMAFAMHTNGIEIDSKYLLQNLAQLTVVDVIYGVAMLRPDAGIVINALQTETTA